MSEAAIATLKEQPVTVNMTHEEARIVVLEDALTQAHHTISHLHNCLVYRNRYSYVHPLQTLERLASMEKLIDPNKGMCFHSILHPGTCDKCDERLEMNRRLAEATALLSAEEDSG